MLKQKQHTLWSCEECHRNHTITDKFETTPGWCKQGYHLWIDKDNDYHKCICGNDTFVRSNY